MTKPRYGGDPSWSRSKPKSSKKRRKLSSRSSSRLIANLIRQKRVSDKKKGLGGTTCVTRTVELPSTHEVGEERNKLLFMLAIGLMPKVDKPKKHYPLVSLERLDPKVEAEAKARTKEIIFKIFEDRKKELLRERIIQMNQVSHPLPECINYQNRRYSNSSQPEPSTSPPPVNGVDVEFVDLVSEDEEDLLHDSADDSEPEVLKEVGYSHCHREYPRLSIIPIKSPCLRQRQETPPPPEKVLYCSKPWLQQKRKVHNGSNHAHALKSLVNNQTHDGGQLFRNFNPESLSRIMNLPPSSENSNSSGSSENSRSKFLSSLKSIPTTTTSFTTVTTSSFMSRKPSAASKGPMMTKNTIEDNSLESEFILADDIITID